MTATVRKRFVFTIGSNLLRSLLSFATAMLLARWLGPATFGGMAFLLGTFVGIRQLLDMGSTQAFFTFMSQQPRSRRFFGAYVKWIAIQFLVPLCVTGLLLPSSWVEFIWHGQQRGLVLIAFVAAFAQDTVWAFMQQAAESQRQTFKAQTIGICIVAAHLLAVVLLWLGNRLELYWIFVLIAVENLLAAVVAYRVCVAGFLRATEPQSSTTESVLRAYLRYCLPLVPYSWISFAYVFADRWLLQSYGGSVQQAFYSVGAQISSVALLATSSILQIFWKEIAEAHHRQDHARTVMLYRRVSRLLFLVGAIIAGFLYPWAQDLLRLLLGAAYVGGGLTLAIMLFYPLHQSMGQIGSTMLYATEKVATQVRLGTIAMVVSIAATYFMLAPPAAPVPGLGLGSVGLALKMVVIQMVQVNIVAYVIARTWRWTFDWRYQPVTMLGCAVIGWFAHGAATHFAANWLSLPAVMTVAGVLYVVLVGAFVFVMPRLSGFTREEIAVDLSSLWRRTLAEFR